MSTDNYGTIRNYKTGEFIRTATFADWQRSQMHADKQTGRFVDIDGPHGAIYLDGGPKSVEDQADEDTNFFQR